MVMAAASTVGASGSAGAGSGRTVGRHTAEKVVAAARWKRAAARAVGRVAVTAVVARRGSDEEAAREVEARRRRGTEGLIHFNSANAEKTRGALTTKPSA